MEVFVVSVMLACAVFVASSVLRGARSRGQLARRLGTSGLVAVAVGVVLHATATPEAPPAFAASLEVAADGYLTSSTRCQRCHPGAFATWSASYHPRMTQAPSPGSIVADFAGVTLELDGRTWTLGRDGDTYTIQTDARYEVALVTGSHHMQAFWYRTTEDKRLDILPFMWLIDEQRWVPRRSAFLRPPGTGDEHGSSRWNTTCARCHTTHARPRKAPRKASTGAFDTQVAELGIGCQSCHGPGAAHARVQRDPLRRYRHHLTGGDDATVVHPERIAPERSAQICGQCHGIHEFPDDASMARSFDTGYAYRPGDDLAATRIPFRPERIDDDPRLREIDRRWPEFVRGSFWSDGTVRVSGREYNGLLESPCFDHGDASRGVMTCLSCHALHAKAAGDLSSWADDQLKPGMRGDEACLQCHERFRDGSAHTSHTGHARESTGSRCQNCHMPYTTFGLLKAIRSHTITSPSVANARATGRPDACSLCHLDRPLAWTARHLAARYGQEPLGDVDEAERDVAAAVLWALRGDAGQRALVAWSMGWAPAIEASRADWAPLYLIQLLDDPYDAVRFVAWRSLRTHRGFGDLEFDFVAPRAERLQSIRAAYARWERDRPRHRRDAVLIGFRGVVDGARISTFGRARDDRPLTLLE